MHQLGLRRFKVSEQPHHLQGCVRQILRFVNHDDKLTPRPRLCCQSLLQLLMHACVVGCGSKSDIAQNTREQITWFAVAIDIEEKNTSGRFPNIREKTEQKSRFA